MALAALTAESSLMHIVRLMAGSACNIRLLELPAQVAGFAGSDAVNADERETGQIVFEKHAHVPAALVMAIGTILTLLSLVNIDRPVAVDTGSIRQSIHRRGTVTGITHEILMQSLEGKLGVLFMIEFDLFPTLHIVAVLTLLAVATLMLIILCMTGETVLRQLFLVRPGGMTGVAFD